MLFYRVQWKKFIKWIVAGAMLFFIYDYGKSLFKDDIILKGNVTEFKEKNVHCTLPDMPLWPSEEAKNQILSNSVKLNCSSNAKDWAYILNGTFYIRKEIEKLHGKISCYYNIVLRQLYDMDFTLTTLQPIENNTPIPADILYVKCAAEDGVVNYRTYLGVKPIIKETSNKDIDTKIKVEGLDLNIIMFGFDTVSRLQWKRLLPKSYDWFEKIGGVILENYNIVGDGTPQALLPILTGFSETDLPEARRGYRKAKYVDSHPWIWKELHELGYVTQWGEDSPAFGTFVYRMLGFKDQPVNHYMRPFFLKQNEYKCMGDRPTHQVFIDYLKEFITVYGPNRRKFSFLFHSDYSHDSQYNLVTADDDLVSLMHWLNETNELEKSLFILMADHGPRFTGTRNTELGKYEERLPFMGLRLPQTETFRLKFPLIQSTLKRNAKILTTPFDIHETFVDVLRYQATRIRKKRPYLYKMSLFQDIPSDRNCQDAFLAPHWCTCMKWYKISTVDHTVLRAATFAVDFLNNMTHPHREMCALLEPHKLTSALFITSNEALLSFKKSRDDHGRDPDLTDDMKASTKIYQIIFSTLPNHAVYEITLKYSLETGNFTMSSNDISRLNAYKGQPKCIMDQYPHLRQFCYCI